MGSPPPLEGWWQNLGLRDAEHHKSPPGMQWWGQHHPSGTLFFSKSSAWMVLRSVSRALAVWRLLRASTSSRSSICARSFLFSLSRLSFSVSSRSRRPHSAAFSACSRSIWGRGRARGWLGGSRTPLAAPSAPHARARPHLCTQLSQLLVHAGASTQLILQVLGDAPQLVLMDLL